MPRSTTKDITACVTERLPQKIGVMDFQKRALELRAQEQ